MEKRGKKRDLDRGRDPRCGPLRWLEETDPQDIAQALLALPGGKAAQVVYWTVNLGGPEVGRRIDALIEGMRTRPMPAVLKILGALLDR